MRISSSPRPRQATLLVAVHLLWLAAACDSALPVPLLPEPTIVGAITAMDTTPAGPRILVEENPRVSEPLASGGAKIWFALTERTRVFDARGREPRAVNRSVLRVGHRVAAMAEGLIRDSYPQQTSADTVVVIP